MASAKRSRKPKPLRDPAGVVELADSRVRTERTRAASERDICRERLRGKGESKTWGDGHVSMLLKVCG